MSGAARFPDGMERRAAAELRAASGRRLVGYAAIFGVAAQIGGFVEVIRRGAFSATLANGGDVLCLADHDLGRLLGRTRSGTLRLAEDTRGLHFELDLPDTTLGRDMLALAERSDLGGMSFGFRATEEAWPASDRRELIAVELLEVSVVAAHPAYASTTVEPRRRAAQGDALARRRFLETL